MEAARAAAELAGEVKQRLPLMLMVMDGFAEGCVREPVRNSGLSDETKVYKGFFVNDGSLSLATDVIEADVAGLPRLVSTVA